MIHTDIRSAIQKVDSGSANTELYAVRLKDGEASKTMSVALTDADSHGDATALLNRMYEGRGYGNTHQIPRSTANTTFTTSIDDKLVGTLTLGVDSPAGLATDATFKKEIDAVRSKPGARVCDLTKLALDNASESKRKLAAMFHVIFIYGQSRHDCTDLFIEVNPRHALFYEAMLGFERIGAPKMNDKVAAPAQLMQLSVADIRGHIDRNAGKDKPANRRSLYPYFFGPEEEGVISTQLSWRTPKHTMPPVPALSVIRPHYRRPVAHRTL